jgi:hypothetical protein
MQRVTDLRIRAAVTVATVLVAMASLQAPAATATPARSDTLTTRATAELAKFTDWLEANRARGYIGEVGWPGGADSERWNQLAKRWYRDADAANLWVTAWATGEWWGTTYPLASYVDRTSSKGVDTPGRQARVLEQHRTTTGYLRGINVAGGEFAAPDVESVHSFSNANPGAYGRDYHYDTQETFSYLAARGVKIVRLPFRWERIAPNLGQKLNQAEVRRLKATVARARVAGLQVILDMHNYGGYYRSDGVRGVRFGLGSPQVPISSFADAWRRISIHFKNDRAVLGYGLMNEPVNMPAREGMAPQVVWERASQAALSAIRANWDRKWVMVSSYPWGGVWAFQASHPKAWINDPARMVRYEAHQYFDHDNSGRYRYDYEGEAARASSP